MTESINPTPGVGVSEAYEGVILQRGGEELALQKTDDRFTVRLLPNHLPEELTAQMATQTMQPLPSVNLVELQVAPAQLEVVMQQARDSGAVEFASHVYRLETSPDTLMYVTDQLTVQFADTVDRAAIAAVVNELGLQAIEPVAGVPQAFVFRVTDRAEANPIKLANRLMRRSDVLVAEPNVAVQTQPLYRPQDPQYPRQWYLNNAGGTTLAAGSHIFVEAAWEITRGVRSVAIAVADDGFDLNHPDFQGNGKVAFPRDFQENDLLPMPGPQDDHGTACAGVAVAEENGVGIVGVAPGCTLIPIRTTGYLDDTAIEALFNWMIQRGAAVASCSWGPSAIYFPLSLRQRAVLTRAATEGRGGKGCVIVFAAGNSNRPVSGTVNERGWSQNVVSGSTNWLNGFAVHPDVIAVSACTSLNRKSAYSNWGRNISVAAPSNNGIPSIWLPETGYIPTGPQIQTPLRGEGVFTSDRLGAAGYDTGDFTSNFGGTSSACPVVAGVAALVLSVNPNLTAREVKQLLQDTADKIVDPTVDPQLGTEYGTYDSNGHSFWFGYGKVNALRAVQAARQRLPQPQPVARQVQQQNTTAIDIPDFNAQGVTSAMQLTAAGGVRDLQITIDIEHSFMGDLEISLISPQTIAVLLQGRTLGRLTRLQKTYSLQTTPALTRLLDRPANGRWQLKVVDYAPLNTGRLRSWKLTVGLA
ncbi:MAG: S8 family serine peptidase [Leptolyngbyaceae cyanobacterium SL_7_1]|nr:S8 family serine peptidase [Leptolyngbyaceae cyanobacterium SL_7_1]